VVTGCTFVNNTDHGFGGYGGFGGAVAIEGYPTALISNSTFVGNTVGSGQGGAVASAANARINNSTFSGNTATGRGGALFASNATTITVSNTVIQGAENCAIGPTGSITSAGYNIENGTTCGFTQTGDRQGTDALLSPLADNGGQTETMAINPQSPAYDAADDFSAEETDQRGVSRPQGVHSDVGAFEFSGTTVTATPTITAAPTATPAPTRARGRRWRHTPKPPKL
jgi:predicted outer membrane repeat protein